MTAVLERGFTPGVCSKLATEQLDVWAGRPVRVLRFDTPEACEKYRVAHGLKFSDKNATSNMIRFWNADGGATLFVPGPGGIAGAELALALWTAICQMPVPVSARREGEGNPNALSHDHLTIDEDATLFAGVGVEPDDFERLGKHAFTVALTEEQWIAYKALVRYTREMRCEVEDAIRNYRDRGLEVLGVVGESPPSWWYDK